MVGLAFGVDVDDLDELTVEGPVARAMGDAIGDTIIFVGQTGLTRGYYGTARLTAIVETSVLGRVRLMFDDVRRLAASSVVELPLLPANGLALLDRENFRRMLDPEPFAAAGFAEATQIFDVEIPASDIPNELLRTLRDIAGGRCMVTGERLPPNSLITFIRHRSEGGNMHANNCLMLCREAEAAFRLGHWTILDDFTIVVNVGKIATELLSAINPSGRLRVSLNTGLQPALDNLRAHQRFFGVNVE